MTEKTQAELKAEEQKKLAKEEAKREEAEIKAQEKAEADKIAKEEKAIADAEAEEAKADEKAEKGHKIVVVDVADYVGKIDSGKMNGVPRRLAAIRLMFEDLGIDKYVATCSYKGTEAFVFKK